jgi:hypothetical protein
MKRLLTFFALLAVWPGFGATITNTIVDPAGNPVAVAVKFTLLSSPYGDTNLFIVAKPVTFTTGTNGLLTNVLRQGLYQVDFGNYYGGVRILVPNDAGYYDLMTIATNLPTWQVTNYMQVFAGATLLTDLGTAYYSNATAFLLSYQTNQPLSQITNAGTIAYSNAASYFNATNLSLWYFTTNNGAFLTNLNLANATNTGTAAYSNSTVFAPNTYAGVSNAMRFAAATNITGVTATKLLYTTNLSGVEITNTIVISNGVITSWSP